MQFANSVVDFNQLLIEKHNFHASKNGSFLQFVATNRLESTTARSAATGAPAFSRGPSGSASSTHA